MSHRSTFSLAQLLLLTTLSGLLCAWLRATVEWIRDQPNSQQSASRLSSDGKRLINVSRPFGFSVFDTDSERCLIQKNVSIHPERSLMWDANLTTVYTVDDSNESPLSKSHSIQLLDLETGAERQIQSPPLEGFSNWFPMAVDSDGHFVDLNIGGESDQELRYWHPNTSPKLIRHWKPSTGEVIRQQIVEGESVDSVYQHSKGRLLLIGRDYRNQPESKSNLPAQSFPETVQPLQFSFVEWRLQNGVVRTLIPMKDFFVPRLLCLNSREDQALLYQILKKRAGKDTASLLLVNANTGAVRDLGLSPFEWIFMGEMTADETCLVGVGEKEGRKLVFRLDLANLKYRRVAGLSTKFYGHENAVTDLRLVNDERQIALAFENGDFRLLDATTGQDIQAAKQFAYRRPRTIWWVFGSVATIWTIFWWRATRRKKEQDFDWGRYAVLFVRLLGFFAGVLILLCRDQYHAISREPLVMAVIVAAIGAGANFGFLWKRNCNRLAAAFTLLACACIAGYVAFLTATLS
jgi:hypothetical protein